MKSLFTITLTGLLVIFFSANLSAQEAPKPTKHDNPEWKWVVHVDYHSGKAGKAMDIIRDYYMKAQKKAGTPAPELIAVLETGQYDLMIIWNMTNGVEDLNWKISPNNIKWRAALNEVAGSKEKADEILAEYQTYVNSSKSELIRSFK